jgi:Carboxypeptidase regulatory-like domain
MPRNLLMLIAVAVLALFAPAAFAQMVTGSIAGTVTDSTGAIVANATVTITNTDEGAVIRTVQTNASGQYLAPLLPVGHYAVTVEAPHFKRSQQTNLALDANRQRAGDGHGHRSSTGSGPGIVAVANRDHRPADS